MDIEVINKKFELISKQSLVLVSDNQFQAFIKLAINKKPRWWPRWYYKYVLAKLVKLLHFNKVVE